MIAFDGQNALSPFRLDRLNARLDALHRGARVQASWFVYFLDAERAPQGEEWAGTGRELFAAFRASVGPADEGASVFPMPTAAADLEAPLVHS